MICVQNPASGECKRLPDDEAHKLIAYGWRYIPKAVYKAWQIAKYHNDRLPARPPLKLPVLDRRF